MLDVCSEHQWPFPGVSWVNTLNYFKIDQTCHFNGEHDDKQCNFGVQKISGALALEVFGVTHPGCKAVPNSETWVKRLF